MTDIALIFDPAELSFDAAMAGPDLATETGLATAIYMSLFSDRRALDADTIPDGSNDRRGWWGDYAARVDGDRIGSRLWLLKRAKRTPETLRRVVDYAREALQWLLDDGIAQSLDLVASAPGQSAIGLVVTLTRPDGNTSKFNYVWDGLNG